MSDITDQNDEMEPFFVRSSRIERENRRLLREVAELRAELEKLREEQRWISVKENLPKPTLTNLGMSDQVLCKGYVYNSTVIQYEVGRYSTVLDLWLTEKIIPSFWRLLSVGSEEKE